jgi:hypothetical protein
LVFPALESVTNSGAMALSYRFYREKLVTVHWVAVCLRPASHSPVKSTGYRVSSPVPARTVTKSVTNLGRNPHGTLGFRGRTAWIEMSEKRYTIRGVYPCRNFDQP